MTSELNLQTQTQKHVQLQSQTQNNKHSKSRSFSRRKLSKKVISAPLVNENTTATTMVFSGQTVELRDLTTAQKEKQKEALLRFQQQQQRQKQKQKHEPIFKVNANVNPNPNTATATVTPTCSYTETETTTSQTNNPNINHEPHKKHNRFRNSISSHSNVFGKTPDESNSQSKSQSLSQSQSHSQSQQVPAIGIRPSHEQLKVNTSPKKSSKKLSDMRKSLMSFSSNSSKFRLSHYSSITKTNTLIDDSANRRRTIQPSRSATSSSINSYTSNSNSPNLDKTMISLPVPINTSREKLNNKLRASNSLLSLSYSNSNSNSNSNSHTNNNHSGGTSPIITFEQSMQQHLDFLMKSLLNLCNSNEILNFTDFLNSRKSNISNTNSNSIHISKLSEAKFSEVYLEQILDSSLTSNGVNKKVLKVLPFGNDSLDQIEIQDIIQELTIGRQLTDTNGFVNMIEAYVVKGKYPDELIRLWDRYKKNNNNNNNNNNNSQQQSTRFEKYRPDYYQSDQHYCIIIMEDAGLDLKKFQLTSWNQAKIIFWKVVQSLSEAEKNFQFEHRDLHWGNIIIKPKKIINSNNNNRIYINNDNIDDENIEVTLIDFTLSRANFNGMVIFTGLDHPEFFRGKGDYQFEVYRIMRQLHTNTQHLTNNNNSNRNNHNNNQQH